MPHDVEDGVTLTRNDRSHSDLTCRRVSAVGFVAWYGGEVIRRSRVLLKQMIADLDQLLLQLREARQINAIKS